jgi:hypothetical protein
MSTKQSYDDKYKTSAGAVLSSKALVAAAGRWWSLEKIEAERTRHYQLMESLP